MLRLNTFDAQRHHQNLKYTNIKRVILIKHDIADKNPDKLLQWEIDFPESDMEFTPFLGTTIRIHNVLHHKFYRKQQKKDITLHYSLHHPLKMKVAVIKNFYRAAEKSSSPKFVEEC